MKRNEATLNRPEGDRVIDAAYVFINFESFIQQVKDEGAWHKNDRNGITLFKTDELTTVLTRLHKNASLKDNEVNGFFQVQVLEGKIKIETDDGDIEMKEGEMIVFHPRVKHTIEAQKKSTLLLQTIHEKML